MFMDVLELKKLIEDSDIILGGDRTIKLLKAGKIDRVILSNDSKKNMLEKIRVVSQKVAVIQTDRTKDDLAELCKKPFHISVIGILSGKKSAKKSK
jgi:ribosomal protein L30E